MPQWTLEDIPWHTFDAGKASPELVSLIKAASMVEHNGYDYGRYLCEVFSDDEEFQHLAKNWAEEEVQHGRGLRKWAELADPDFDFDSSFKTFTTGYTLPLNVTASVRGSRSGELVARCMVEIGTSSYYRAIADHTEEPVLKALCAKIAADELRHYKLFYTHLKRYLDIENPSKLKRLKILLSRVAESEDDELAYAFYAAHRSSADEIYDRKTYARLYLASAGRCYQKSHVEQMVPMALKAIGLKRPQPLLTKCLGFFAWNFLQLRLWLSGLPALIPA